MCTRGAAEDQSGLPPLGLVSAPFKRAPEIRGGPSEHARRLTPSINPGGGYTTTSPSVIGVAPSTPGYVRRPDVQKGLEFHQRLGTSNDFTAYSPRYIRAPDDLRRSTGIRRGGVVRQ